MLDKEALRKLPEFANLSPEEFEYAIKILEEFEDSGNSEAYENLKYSDFREIPVDVETFIRDKRYLGNGLTNADGKFMVFNYWVETLKKLFPDNLTTAYNTLILTGGIGLGKSLVAVLCELYMLYRVLCLKDPFLYYGLMPSDTITFGLLNISIKVSEGVA